MEKEFWDKKWQKNETGWDIGYANPMISNYFNAVSNIQAKILIPGCGNAYEAESLFNLGFENVWIIDISPHAINSFIKRVPNFPKNQIICGDFFELDDQFDFIIEQTFFCALHPYKRGDYCSKIAKLLYPSGILVGLLFNFPLSDGPPFGGDEEEYRKRFSRVFEKIELSEAKHSIKPREGREFWIQMQNPISQ